MPIPKLGIPFRAIPIKKIQLQLLFKEIISPQESLCQVGSKQIAKKWDRYIVQCEQIEAFAKKCENTMHISKVSMNG